MTARILVFAAVVMCASAARAERAGPFILGADISWIPEDEAAGATYLDHGVRKDIFQILKEHGFNYVRLRVFVDPMSQRGYSRRRGQPFCDLNSTLAMAKRASDAGMGIFLCFHYSDTWADPEHQSKPAAWEGLAFDELVEKFREHTRQVVQALHEQGTPPQLVQIGNEITHGMLWPDARVASLIPSGNAQTDANAARSGIEGLGHYNNLATLLKVGVEEVRRIDPSIRIVLHNHLGRHNLRMREWLDNLISRNVDFDIIGVSCYAQGKEGDWQENFADLAQRYPKYDILVCEYSARKRYVNDLTFNIPDRKGLGTFIWEPTRHREALFDQNGYNAGGGQASNFVQDMGINQGATTNPTTRPRRINRGGRFDTNDLIDLYPEMARAYGNAPSN